MEEDHHVNTATSVAPSSLNSIPVFRTGDSARQWLEWVERHARLFKWPEASKLEVARCRLGGEAQVWEMGAAKDITKWQEFKQAFLERYDVREEELYDMLTNCRQGQQETVREYADRYRHLAAQLGIATSQDPSHLYNFLRGLHRHIYREVYLMRPKSLADAIEDAVYISRGLDDDGGGKPPVYGNAGPRGPDTRGSRVLVVPRASLPTPTGEAPRPLPRMHDRPRYGERPPRLQEWPRGRPEGDRRGQGRPAAGGDAPASPSAATPTAAPTAAKPTGSTPRKDEVEELRQQLARLQLTMQQVMGIDANYYTAQEELGAWGPVDEEGWMYGPNSEVYLKRVAEFEPMPLPRKRVAAAPGQTAPRFPPTGPPRLPTRGPAVPRANPLPPGRQDQGPDPVPTPPQRPPAAEAQHQARPFQGPPAPRWTPAGRPRRGEAGPRTDPIPDDPQAEERRIADEIVGKINKYAVPLGVALQCDPGNIYARVGARVSQIARQHARGRQQAGGEAAPAGQENAQANPDGPAPMVALVNDAEGTEAMAAAAANPPAAGASRLQVCRANVKLTNAYGEAVPVVAVIDSGASHTVIPYDTLRKLDLVGAMEETPVTFVNADGNRGRAAGVVRGLQVALDDMIMTVDAFVSKALNYGILLGTDFLYPIRATLCYDKRRLEYTNDAAQRSSIPIYFLKVPPGRGSCLHLQRDSSSDTEEETYLQQVEGVVEDAGGRAVGVAPGANEGESSGLPGSEQGESEGSGDSDVTMVSDEPPTPLNTPSPDRQGDCNSRSAEEADPSSSLWCEEGSVDSWDRLLQALGTAGDWPNRAVAGVDQLQESDDEQEPYTQEGTSTEDSSTDDEAEDHRVPSMSEPAGSEEEDEAQVVPTGGLWWTVGLLEVLGAEPYGSGTGATRAPEVDEEEPPTGPPNENEWDHRYVTKQAPAEHLRIARRYRQHVTTQHSRGEPGEEVMKLLEAAINPELEPQESESIRAQLRSNWDLFALTNSDLGRTTWASIKIDTGDHPPIAQNPYRMSPKERDAVDKELARMAEDGIIEPSTSPWVSPAVLVEKKEGGGTRFCVDLRKVNGVTTTVRYPLGTVAELIDRVTPPGGQSRVYSTLDLKSGYWQVPIADEASRERTAFATPTSQWQYTVMPMGLKNSAAVFAALMNKVLRPLLGRCALAYLDDIIIYSSTTGEHCQHLLDVFDLLRLAGLKISAKKCHFGYRQVEFLGFVIDGEYGTVTPCPRNVANLEALPAPRNLRELRAVLGLAGYYRHMVEGFSIIAEPLYTLLRQDVPWGWTELEEEAFQRLKNAVTSYPILRAPDFNRPFLLQTDWCTTAVAACLSQRDDAGCEYAVQFASKKLSGSQLNWSSAHGEAFAAVWAVKHFRPYLHGSHFTLVTDSMAVRHLKTAGTRDLSGKLARYALLLQAYDFDIVHKPGAKHGNVDGLSRLAHLLGRGDGSDDDEDGGASGGLWTPTEEEAATIEVLMTDGMWEAEEHRGGEVRRAPGTNPQEPHTRAATAGRPQQPSSQPNSGLVYRQSIPTGQLAPLRRLVMMPPYTERAAACGPTPAGTGTAGEHGTGQPQLTGTDREPSARDLAREAGDDNTPNEQDEIQPDQGEDAQGAVTGQKSSGGKLSWRAPVGWNPEVEESPSEDEDPDLVCQVCGKGKPSSTMLICDKEGCETGWHMSCLPEPITEMPDEGWLCPRCTDGSQGGAGADAREEGEDQEEPSSSRTDGDEPYEEPEERGEEEEEVEEGEEGDVPGEDTQLLAPMPERPPAAAGQRAPGRQRNPQDQESAIWGDHALLTYLKTEELPYDHGVSAVNNLREVRRIMAKAKSYSWEDGQLYQLRGRNRVKVRVVRQQERKALVEEAHGMAHWGINKTHSLLKARVYWDGMRRDVEEYVRQCEKCKAQHHKLLRSAPLNPQPLVPLWSRVHIDMMGPYTTTPNGNRFIIIAVDSWSKFPEVGALPSKASRLTRNFFYQQWIARYGCCEVLYSDNGSEWQDEFAALLREHRITHQRIAPYTPHSNGMAERMVGVLLGSLRKLVNEHSTDWDGKLYQVAYAYRATRQDSTRVSPALCLYGRELSTAGTRPPAQVRAPAPLEELIEEGEEEMTEEHYAALQVRRLQLEQVAQGVDGNLQKAKAKNERDYNARQYRSRPCKRVRFNEPDPTPTPAAPSATAAPRAAPGVGPTCDGPSGSQGRGTPCAAQCAAGGGPYDLAGSSQEEGPAVSLVEDEALPHVPDLAENTLVYRKIKRKTKLDPDREGPYFFHAWHPTGKWALVLDAEGKRITVQRSRLLIPDAATKAAEAQPGGRKEQYPGWTSY